MISSFFGIEIAKRAIFSSRSALDVIAHNIANANTKGYSREEGLISTTPPISLPSIGIIGTGAHLSAIRRIRDEFLDIQYRDENRIKDYWDTLETSLEEIEYLIGEPSDNGLSNAINDFWSGWQELSTNPESMAIRGSLIEKSQTLISLLSHIRKGLIRFREQIDKDLAIQVDSINEIAKQIGALNEEIKRAYVRGQSPNDLLDKRDLLLDELSSYVNFDVAINEVGEAIINIRDHTLVGVNNTVYKMIFRDSQVLWENGDRVYLKDGQGKLASLIYARDNIIGISDGRGYIYESGYIGVIDRITESIFNRVNELHRSGYGLDNSTGNEFFSLIDTSKGVTADNIKIADIVLQDVSKIAASTNLDSPGDGSNALKIAQINREFLIDGSFTINDYWNNQTSTLGFITQRARWLADNQKSLVDAIERERESVSGVSIDEEVVNMIRYQNAFSAASRILSTLDEMLSILIERTGVVGR